MGTLYGGRFMDVTTVGSNISAITGYGASPFGRIGCFGHDDVSNIYGICDKPCPKK